VGVLGHDLRNPLNTILTTSRKHLRQPNVNANASTPGIEKLDLELSIGDRSRFSNQLIQALLRDRAVTLGAYITSMACAWRLSIDEHSKRDGSSARGWSHDEVEIARMKSVCDPPAGGVHHGSLCLHRPLTGNNPCSLYRAVHARTYASVRSQLMQVYVQKSTRATLPCRSAAVSGAELSQGCRPTERGQVACAG
jgi:hypothetical protein